MICRHLTQYKPVLGYVFVTHLALIRAPKINLSVFILKKYAGFNVSFENSFNCRFDVKTITKSRKIVAMYSSKRTI